MYFRQKCIQRPRELGFSFAFVPCLWGYTLLKQRLLDFLFFFSKSLSELWLGSSEATFLHLKHFLLIVLSGKEEEDGVRLVC